jgi:hypothetical protein
LIVWRGNDPNVTVVLLEDLAAVFGVTIAAGCMTLTHFTNNPLYDAAGSKHTQVFMRCLEHPTLELGIRE